MYQFPNEEGGNIVGTPQNSLLTLEVKPSPDVGETPLEATRPQVADQASYAMAQDAELKKVLTFTVIGAWWSWNDFSRRDTGFVGAPNPT